MSNESKQGGLRPGAGRPPGTRSTENSTLVARIRASTGLAQAELALRVGVREKTIYNYEKQSIIPKAGKTRDALNKIAVEAGISIEEFAP